MSMPRVLRSLRSLRSVPLDSDWPQLPPMSERSDEKKDCSSLVRDPRRSADSVSDPSLKSTLFLRFARVRSSLERSPELRLALPRWWLTARLISAALLSRL